MALEWAGGGEDSLELDTADDIWQTRIAELGARGWGKFVEAIGNHDGTDVKLDNFGAVGVIYSFGLAGTFTGHALGAQSAIKAASGFGKGLLLGETQIDGLEAAAIIER